MSKNNGNANKGKSEKAGFGTFASVRIMIGIVVVTGCLFLGSMAISFFTTPEGKDKSAYKETVEQYPLMQKADDMIEGLKTDETKANKSEALDMVEDRIENPGMESGYLQNEFLGERETYEGEKTSEESPIDTRDVPTAENIVEESPQSGHGEEVKSAVGHGTPESAPQKVMTRKVIGVAFVEALVEPLEYELKDRFWGWRPDDLWISKFGMDNVENYQLGVREVARRTANILAERIARTGSNVSYNKYLDDAVNSLTVDPGSYWWPSAKSEYKRAIDDLRKYKEQLARGEESFYTRPDNLIPLLIEYRTRLGDCDNKLVRIEGIPATQVSTFEADDRFYYVKGVAAAMLPVLEAIQEDFYLSLKTRDGIETLHHAIEACKGAAHMSPWIVTEGNYNGFLANHRANMATYISHARFYIGVLITTLST